MVEGRAQHEAFFAEYDSPHGLLTAIERLRELGYRDLDAYTPYSNEELREALGQRRSRLPVAIFIGGMTGAVGAYLLQYLLVSYLYPLNAGGRPPHMPLAFMIITFEMGILLAAFTAFFGVLKKGRLLRLYDPVFEVDGIGRSTIDRHWLRVAGTDPRFDLDRTRAELASTHAARVLHHGVRRGGTS